MIYQHRLVLYSRYTHWYKKVKTKNVFKKSTKKILEYYLETNYVVYSTKMCIERFCTKHFVDIAEKLL